MRKTKKYKDHLLEALKDSDERAAYLNAALEEDPESFFLALKDIADACGGVSKLAKKSSLNREALYKTLSVKGNPRFASLLSMLHALGLDIYIQSASA